MDTLLSKETMNKSYLCTMVLKLWPLVLSWRLQFLIPKKDGLSRGGDQPLAEFKGLNPKNTWEKHRTLRVVQVLNFYLGNFSKKKNALVFRENLVPKLFLGNYFSRGPKTQGGTTNSGVHQETILNSISITPKSIPRKNGGV